MMQVLSHILRFGVPLIYLMVSLGYVFASVKKRPAVAPWIGPALLIGLVAHALVLVLIPLEHSRLPFATPFEGLAFSGWIFVVFAAGLVFSQKEENFGAFLFPVGFVVSAAALALVNQQDRLPALLGSQPFMAHTWVLFASYGCFLISAVTSVMYLTLHHQIRARSFGLFSDRLPSLEVMDTVVAHVDAVGTALLLIGIVMGFLWLNSPMVKPPTLHLKIAGSMLAAVTYTCEHIFRMGKGWKGQRASIVSIIGFALLMLTFMAGLHGY